MTEQMEEILDDLDLSRREGGREAGEPLLCEVVRSLTEEDLPLLLAPPPIKKEWKGPQRMRHTHHQIARLVAMGKKGVEVSALTGFSQAYISVLVHQDKPFQELVLYYKENAEAIFVDVLERMKTLGLSALELLQEKIEEDPDGWSKAQLMELAETMLVKPLKGSTNISVGGSHAGGSGPGGLNIGITFVTPQQEQKKEGMKIEEGVVDVVGVDVK